MDVNKPENVQPPPRKTKQSVVVEFVDGTTDELRYDKTIFCVSLREVFDAEKA